MVWPAVTGHEGPGAEGGEIPRHPIRPGMRPGFFPYPRRGMHMRPGGWIPRRPFLPAQNFMMQRKMRPWVPRMPRPPPPPPPHFIPPPPETFLPYPPPPPWPAPPPPPPEHHDAQTADADTTSDGKAKKKKKPVNGTLKPWDREAAEKAHALELECQKYVNGRSIVIKFPDLELSKEIVEAFHPSIDNVHFQGPCGPRYCFVTLKDDADIKKVMEDLNKVKFGVGFLSAEMKVQKHEENNCYENIDPFTLYVGNLALNITVAEVKEKFPSASRIDVGHAKKMKNTRYAFVKFSTTEAALEAYKASVNTIMASRSIIVRFRRHKAPVGPPGEKSATSPDTKPTEKLTVGAKLKIKKEKAAKEAAEAESKSGIKKQEDSDSEEEVEMENDDESLSEYDVEDYDVDADDDDDDDDIDNIVGNTNSEEEEYDMSGDDYEDMDDDDDHIQLPNIKEEDDEYFDNDDDDCRDIFSLTYRSKNCDE